MTIDFEGRRFKSVSNSAGGDVGDNTVFEYRHSDGVVWATYEGGAVRFGTLIAAVLDDGRLDMRYQHVDSDGTIKAGRCISTPEELADGRIRLHESWDWTEGGGGSGTSIVEEVVRT